MYRITVIAAVALAITMQGCSARHSAERTEAPAPAVKVVSSQDATAEWNYLCGAFNFDSFPQGTFTTFEQAYNGSNFAADFESLMRGVSNLMATAVPPFDGDDLLNYNLNNWPDS